VFAATGAGGEGEREIEEREKHIGTKLVQRVIFWKAFWSTRQRETFSFFWFQV
jgi:hypothetical protein